MPTVELDVELLNGFVRKNGATCSYCDDVGKLKRASVTFLFATLFIAVSAVFAASPHVNSWDPYLIKDLF